MIDQKITETLEISMRQLADMAPGAPDLPEVREPMRSHRPVLALASGFAVTIVAIGVMGAVLIRSDDVPPGAGSTPEEAAFAELETAALTATECAENVGLETQPPVYQEDTFTFDFGWIEGTAEQEVAGARCIEELFVPVNANWMDAYGPEPTPPRPSGKDDAAFEVTTLPVGFSESEWIPSSLEQPPTADTTSVAQQWAFTRGDNADDPAWGVIRVRVRTGAFDAKDWLAAYQDTSDETGERSYRYEATSVAWTSNALIEIPISDHGHTVLRFGVGDYQIVISGTAGVTEADLRVVANGIFHP